MVDEPAQSYREIADMIDGVEVLAMQAVSVKDADEIHRLPPHTESVIVQRLDDTAAHSLSRRTSLRALFHSGNSMITDAGVLSLSTLPSLQVLDLEWSTLITDRSLDALAQAVHLVYLDIAFCSGLSDEAITRLRASLPGCHIER